MAGHQTVELLIGKFRLERIVNRCGVGDLQLLVGEILGSDFNAYFSGLDLLPNWWLFKDRGLECP